MQPPSGRGWPRAAGVDGVAAAARRAYVGRATAATGWPPVRWISRLRPDPLRTARLGEGQRQAAERPGQDVAARSVTGPTIAGRHRGAAIRRVRLRRASRRRGPNPAGRPRWSRSDDLPDAIDSAIARTDLGVGTPRTWWRVLSRSSGCSSARWWSDCSGSGCSQWGPMSGCPRCRRLSFSVSRCPCCSWAAVRCSASWSPCWPGRRGARRPAGRGRGGRRACETASATSPTVSW